MIILPIRTKRLLITEFNESMAESVHINSLDEDNRRFIPDEVFETAREAQKTIYALMSFYTQNDKPLVYPVLLHDGRQIGHVQAIPAEAGWEVGYHIAKPYTKNGYATEALSAFLDPIMERIGAAHICGICSASNIASRRVLEKCEFTLKYEGTGILHGKEQPVCRYIKKLYENAKVRVMRESDYECLPEFSYHAIYIPVGASPPPRSVINDPQIIVYIKDFGTQPGDLGVVAEQNGQIIGASWTRIIPAYGHIDSETPELAISILPEFRGYGIGTNLMKKLFEALRENGYKQTSLSVQKDNPAVRFYQRLGYEMSGERIDHVGHEDYLMIKYL